MAVTTGRLTTVPGAILAIVTGMLLLAPCQGHAATVDASAARGKSVLYVFNRTKLEGARAATPLDPKRVMTLETSRRNDLAVVDWLHGLGFYVREADEHAASAETAGQDLIIVSESVGALDVANK